MEPLMEKPIDDLQRHAYWFLLLIPLVIAGFYKTYFAVFFEPTKAVIHFHFTVMALFVAMLIAQPFLIRYQKLRWHRILGKISYVLVPLVLLSGYLMIRFSYFRFLNDMNSKIQQGTVQLTGKEILREAAATQAIAFVYLGLLFLFYILAIYNRRNTHVHSRYMLATALTMLGPTVDRIIFFNTGLEKLAGFIRIETIAFLIADIILATLLVMDYKNKRSTKALWICLIVFVTVQLMYFTLRKTSGWERFVSFVL